jgi:TonB-linked SusC/RagA family outer membrane protein
LRLLSHGQENYTVGGNFYRSGLRSAFGRLSYNYNMKYLSMLSLRYDGSSKFAKGNKWGVFPSISLGWNINNESFWEPLINTISVFKLKGSYGMLGNQSIGTYRYIPVISYDNDNLNYPFDSNNINLGYAVTALPSSSIRWEKTLYKNIGFDAALFNNQVELSFEVYEKYTSDMLTEKPISSATGVYSFPIVNEGELKTRGWEFQMSYRNMEQKLNYNLELNLWHYKSTLEKMADSGYVYEVGPCRTYVGGEIGEFWVWEAGDIFRSQDEVERWNKEHGFKDANGVWNPLQPAAKPGDLRFIDQNGDGILDSNDKIKVGSGVPDITLGLNINLIYNNFDLAANIYGEFGQKRYNYMKRQLQRADKNFNYGRDMLNSWTPNNPDSNIPRAVVGDPNNNNRLSTRYVENGDYIRLNNLQIGYTIPRNLSNSLGIDNLRLYVGGLKLLTFTKYKGYDPGMTGEIGSKGADDALYPLSRTFLAGIQLTF